MSLILSGGDFLAFREPSYLRFGFQGTNWGRSFCSLGVSGSLPLIVNDLERKPKITIPRSFRSLLSPHGGTLVHSLATEGSSGAWHDKHASNTPALFITYAPAATADESKMHSDVHPQIQRAVGRPKMASIVAAVAKAFGVKGSWIRSRHGTEARLITAWLGWYEGLQRLRSIAASLRLRSSGRVSDLVRRCERMLLRNPEMQLRVDDAFAALA